MAKKEIPTAMEKRFISEIRNKIDYCLEQDRTTKEKLQLLAFGILVMLDGEDTSFPPCSVQPIEENDKLGEDIAGNLHNLFYADYK
jgi:hypothetical protein